MHTREGSLATICNVETFGRVTLLEPAGPQVVSGSAMTLREVTGGSGSLSVSAPFTIVRVERPWRIVGALPLVSDEASFEDMAGVEGLTSRAGLRNVL